VDNFSRRYLFLPDLHNNGIEKGEGRVHPPPNAHRRTSVVFIGGNQMWADCGQVGGIFHGSCPGRSPPMHRLDRKSPLFFAPACYRTAPPAPSPFGPLRPPTAVPRPLRAPALRQFDPGCLCPAAPAVRQERYVGASTLSVSARRTPRREPDGRCPSGTPWSHPGRRHCRRPGGSSDAKWTHFSMRSDPATGRTKSVQQTKSARRTKPRGASQR